MCKRLAIEFCSNSEIFFLTGPRTVGCLKRKTPRTSQTAGRKAESCNGGQGQTSRKGRTQGETIPR